MRDRTRISDLQARFDGAVELFDRVKDGPFVRSLVAALDPVTTAAPNGCALELGCGVGNLLARWTREGRPAVGLDLSRGMVVRARKNVGVPVVVGDCGRLPFAHSAFSLVAGIACFQLLSDPARALEEALRVLGSGGVHAFLVQAPDWTEDAAIELGRGLGLDGEELAHMVRCARISPGSRRHSPRDLDELMRRVGFSSIWVDRCVEGAMIRVAGVKNAVAV